jgi:hypothetical protein
MPTAAAAMAAPVAAAMAAVAAADKFYAGAGFPDILLIEDIERRQSDVGDFLLTESEFVAISDAPRRRIHCGAAR